MKIKKRFVHPILFIIAGSIILVMTTSGCGLEQVNSGRLVSDYHVTRSFETFEINQDYQYYILGPVSFPSAVVGISKDYTLESKYWSAIDLEKKDLRKWIWGGDQHHTSDIYPYGSLIKGPLGEHIGIWYSLRHWKQSARIILLDQNRINIWSPGVYEHTPRY